MVIFLKGTIRLPSSLCSTIITRRSSPSVDILEIGHLLFKTSPETFSALNHKVRQYCRTLEVSLELSIVSKKDWKVLRRPSSYQNIRRSGDNISGRTIFMDLTKKKKKRTDSERIIFYYKRPTVLIYKGSQGLRYLLTRHQRIIGTYHSVIWLQV